VSGLPLVLLLLFTLYRISSLLVVAWDTVFAARWEASPLSVYCPKCGVYRGEECRGLRDGYHVAREALVKTGRIES
jgi:hypothetical protein